VPFFRKKPVEIQAIQWTGDNWPEIQTFCSTARNPTEANQSLVIPTLEGNHLANRGDWIIKGVKGEFYPCKPDIFEATYDAA
jgi:hypothetical protein